jgi:hypothetical protein
VLRTLVLLGHPLFLDVPLQLLPVPFELFPIH